jgi:DNA-binding GntR family transcriptional regulator
MIKRRPAGRNRNTKSPSSRISDTLIYSEPGSSIHPQQDSAATPNVATHVSQGTLVRKTAVELVVDALRTRILTGQLAPGLALRQEALAQELGVSRIPLREAIRQLSSEGLVDLLPHRGSYVSMLSLNEVRDFFDVRLQLEPWLIEQATTRVATKDLDHAAQVVRKMDGVSPDQWGQLNWQFHELLYLAADRPLAVNIVRALHEKTERYFRFQIVNTPIRQQAHHEHMNLIALCAARKPKAARVALEHHISEAAQQILTIVGRLLDKAQIDGGKLQNRK